MRALAAMRTAVLCVVGAIAIVAGASDASAQTQYTVTDETTLRDALFDITSNSETNAEVEITTPAITLTQGQADLYMYGSGNVRIYSSASGGTTLTGNGFDRIFLFGGFNAQVELEDLTFSGGRSDFGGGAINSDLNLQVTRCTFDDNVAGASEGSGRGGAIYTFGELLIDDSVFTNNHAIGVDGGSAYGGAIYSASKFGNGAQITNSTFSGNSATGGDEFDFPGRGRGGAIYLEWSSLGIFNSTIASNTVTGGASTGTSGTGADGTGGGVYLNNGQLNVESSTIAGNSAVGGGGVTPGAARGGGLYADAFAGGIVHSTIVGNTASGNGTLEGGGLYVVFNEGSFFFGHNLAYYNFAGGPSDVSGPVASAGFNWVGTAFTASVASDTIGTDPAITTLRDHGGLTQTIAPTCGSPIIGAGDSGGEFPNFDQRGEDRVVGGVIDIGAFEAKAPVMSLPVSPTLSYTEQSGAVPLLSGAQITGNTGPVYGFATLSVTAGAGFLSSEDTLTMANTGSVTVNGGNLTFGGSTVATFTQSTGQLDIAFNSNATAAAVDAVLNAVGFSNSSNQPTDGARTFSYAYCDGMGGAASGATTVTITMVQVNDPPFVGFEVDYLDADEDGGTGGTYSQQISPFVGTVETGQSVQAFILQTSFEDSSTGGSLFTAGGYPTLDTNGTLSFTLAPDVSGIIELEVYAQDNGGTANGGQDVSDEPAYFTIYVNPVNDPPTFTPEQLTYEILEDAGAQAFTNFTTNASVGPTDECTYFGQFLIFETNLTDTSVAFAFGGEAGPYVDERVISPCVFGGELQFQVADNDFGSFTAQVRAFDIGQPQEFDITDTLFDPFGGDYSTPVDVTVNVLPVNDPPSFSLFLEGVEVDEDAGPQSIPNAVGSFDPFEAGQALLEYEVVITDSFLPDGVGALFAPGGAPAIDNSGTLTFTPADDAHGWIEFHVLARDDGGTANGGNDTSAPSPTIYLDVFSVNDPPQFTISQTPVTVDEDSGVQIVQTWLTDIVPGPLDEQLAGEAVFFQVFPDQGNAVAMANDANVSQTGDLAFESAFDVFGTNNYQVIATDFPVGKYLAASSAPQDFQITISPVNDAPSFVAGTLSHTMLEQTSPVQETIAGWATSIYSGSEYESAGGLSFSVTGYDASLFSVPPAVDPQTGDLTWTLAASQYGSTSFDITLVDEPVEGGSTLSTSAVSFSLTVDPLNLPPTFTIPDSSVDINEDEGLQTMVDFVTNISPGLNEDEDETQYPLTFNLVVTDYDGIFEGPGAVAPSIDEAGVLTFQTADDAFGFADIMVTLTDSAVGGTPTSDPSYFYIYADPVNDAPSFDNAGDVAVNEDTGQHAIAWASNRSAGPDNESDQELTYFTTVNSGSALFSEQPWVDLETGELRFTVADNQYGSASVTVYLEDQPFFGEEEIPTEVEFAPNDPLQSEPVTFTITVVPVNDRPTFDNDGDEVAFEDSGVVAFPSWATNISAGPNENQGLAFEVTNDNPGLFSVQPTVTNSGTLTFSTAPDLNGSAQVTVVLRDLGGTANGGFNESLPAVFTVTILPVNDAPSFLIEEVHVSLEDGGAQTAAAFAHTIAAGPADESGQALTFTVTSDNPSLFSVQPAISADGTLTYEAAPNAFGNASVLATLTDSGGIANGGANTSETTAFLIEVQPVNDQPSFQKGSDVSILEDAGFQLVPGWATALTAGAPNEIQVLSFSATTDADELFAQTPFVNAFGDLVFEPEDDANGVATVTISVSDNGGTDNGGVDTGVPQTFTITIGPVNDPPSFTKGGNQQLPENSPAQVIDGWATNIVPGPADESGQTTTFSVTNDNPALFATEPTLSATGTLAYELAPNANGAATVTVILSDDGGTANGGIDTAAPETFTITVGPVNQAPSFVAGEDQQVLEDAGPQTVAGWATGISAGPADESGQTLAFVLQVGNPSLFATQPAISEDGTLTYEPAPDAFGTSSVSVTLTDSGGTAGGGVDSSPTVQFTITIDPVNDAPSFVVGPNLEILEDSGFQSQPSFVTAISPGPANEFAQAVSFLVNVDNPALFSAPPAISPGGQLTYTPQPQAVGTATVTVTALDDGGIGDGGVNSSDPQTFTITVTPVNDEPSFTEGGDVTVLEDSGAYAAQWATDLNAGPPDESSQVLTFDVFTDTPALFAEQPSISDTGVLTFTPADDANGAANITVSMMDDGGVLKGGDDTFGPVTFSITITPVNDAPSFTAGSNQSVPEDSGEIVVLGWAQDIVAGPANESGQTLTFTTTNDNAALFSGEPTVQPNGALVFTLASNATGSATVTVVLSDSGGTANGGVDQSEPATFVISVGDVNEPPSFTAGEDVMVLEDAGAQSQAWASDIAAGPANESTQTVSFEVTNDNAALFAVEPAIASDGTLSFEAVADAFGVANVTVVARDNGGTANGGLDASPAVSFVLTVMPVNDRPTFTGGGDVSVDEDAGPQATTWASEISAGPANESGQQLSFNVTTPDPSFFSSAPEISAAGVLTFETAPGVIGSASVTAELVDDGGTANGGLDTSTSVTFTISVNPANDPPTFTAGEDVTSFEDGGAQVVSGWATDISPGPADESSQSVSFNVSTDNPALFAVEPSITAGGTLSYTSAPDANGSANVTVSLTDDGGGDDTSAEVTFTITVAPVNDAPSFTGGPNQLVPEGSGAQSETGWASDISPGPADEAGQAVTFTVTHDAGPTFFNAAPAVAPDGTLTYELAPSSNGLVNVTVVAKDNGGISNGGVDTSAEYTFVISIGEVNQPPTFTPGTDVSSLEDGGLETFQGWATNISAGPANESFQTVGFNVVTDNDTLFAMPPAIDGNGTLTYMGAPNANGVALVTVAAQDNGGTAEGGQDTSAEVTFTVTIGPVNDPPTAVLGGPVEAPEGSGETSVPMWATDISAGPVDETGQSVTFTLTADDPTLFAAQPTLAVNGTLTFTPAPGVNGSTAVTVVAQDDGGTANGGQDTAEVGVFVITLTPINNAPSFVGGEDVTSLEDEGLVTVSGWASSISPGPEDESEQSVSFLVVTDTPELFVSGPSVDESGTLTYTTTSNMSGSATVTVTAVDDGGTQAGGSDTSAPASFTVTVLPVNDAPSFVAVGDIEVKANEGLLVIEDWATGISPGPADESGQVVDFALVADNESAFVQLPDIDDAGALSFETEQGFAGPLTVTVVLFDDGGTANGGQDESLPLEFTINVTNEGVAPTPIVPTDPDGEPIVLETPEDTPLDIELQASGGVGSYDFTVVSQPANGTITGEPPSLVYTPDANYNGADSFEFTVTAGGVESLPATIGIDVLPVNDPPVFVPPTPDAPIDAIEGTEATFTAAADDVDGPSLSYSADALPSGASLDPVSGEFSWTPTYLDFGAHTFELTVSDGELTDEREIVINVSFIDVDGDFLPDNWELTVGLDPTSADSDGDNIDDGTEVGDWLAGALDTDGDDIIDALDDDSDGDGVPDIVEAGDADLGTPPPDTDGDGVFDFLDEDADGDDIPDGLDNCYVVENTSQTNTDDDELGDACDDDDDNDGVLDETELANGTNPLDVDSDDDTINDGDEYGTGETPADTDGDGIIDALDLDSDGDGVPDEEEAGDTDLFTDPIDTDGDGLPDYVDPDSDDDTVTDGEDNCRLLPNTGQDDADDNTEGDECDGDKDGDDIVNEEDNCELVPNPDQANNDDDSDGDACDSDDDNDGVLDIDDNCVIVPNPDQSDIDGDGNGDLCDEDFDPNALGGDEGCECNAATSGPSQSATVVMLLVAAFFWRRRRSLVR